MSVDCIAANNASFVDQRALYDVASKREFTYKQTHERVGRVASYLSSLGVERGDRVGYLSMNSTDILEIIFGTWRIGAISLALNFRLTANELEFIVNDAMPDVIIYDEAFAAVVEELKGMTHVKHWIMHDGALH